MARVINAVSDALFGGAPQAVAVENLTPDQSNVQSQPKSILKKSVVIADAPRAEEPPAPRAVVESQGLGHKKMVVGLRTTGAYPVMTKAFDGARDSAEKNFRPRRGAGGAPRYEPLDWDLLLTSDLSGVKWWWHTHTQCGVLSRVQAF